MNDWNGNGRYDSQDSFIDYTGANSGRHSGSSSDWTKWIFLILIFLICAPIGIIVFFYMLLSGK